MGNIVEMIDVLYAYKLGIPVVCKDSVYCSWYLVCDNHVFDFHNRYVIIYNGDIESRLRELNKK